ncbi:MAG: hypothetical protein QOJ09_2752 [Actinomycetota bacterium]|nr:hypothetical protein [Actinomycetota bacterium]
MHGSVTGRPYCAPTPTTTAREGLSHWLNLHVLPERSTRLALTPRRHRLVGLAAAALFVASVVGLLSLPTAAASADDVVPAGARVVGRARVGGARVLLLSRGNRLHLLVAYRRHEGWHGVEVAPPPARSAAAWAATRGGAGVPSLSAVYGTTDGARIKVEWVDGRTGDAPVRPDHTYLVARGGHVRSKAVSILGADGVVLSTIDGP